jgi:hypothetical protein
MNDTMTKKQQNFFALSVCDKPKSVDSLKIYRSYYEKYKSSVRSCRVRGDGSGFDGMRVFRSGPIGFSVRGTTAGGPSAIAQESLL